VAAENWVRAQEAQLGAIKNLFKNPADVVKSVQELQDTNKTLQKEIERLQLVQAHYLKHELLQKAKHIGGLKVVLEKVDITNKDATKQLCTEIHQLAPESIVVLACEEAGKATLTVSIPRELVEARQIDAIKIIKHIASEIQGGGGGQNFYATAGGKNPAGIGAALDKAKEYILAL
jgi:alanyl-tRNA synthetase